MNSRLLTSAVLAASLLVFGCGDDETSGTGGAGATGGSGGAGGGVVPKTCDDIPDTTNYIVENAPPTSREDCDQTLTATGDNDHEAIITAIVLAGENGVVCLEPGEYAMGGTIAITTTPGLKFKGLGDSPDDVMLDYYADNAAGCSGTEGINVNVNNVTIENMWVKNSCANGVVQTRNDGSVVSKVRVSWDDRCVGPRALATCGQSCVPLICDNNSDNAGDVCTADGDCPPNDGDPSDGKCADAACSNGDSADARLFCDDGVCANNMTANGAYGIYPTFCANTLVEYCQVQGASDAGIYIGLCEGGMVENNVVYENVAGLEVENSLSIDVSNNEIFNNVGGLLALQQDIAPKCDAASDNAGESCTTDDDCPNGACETRLSNSDIRMFDCEVYCNNHDNFAQPGSAVSGIPVGTGVLSFVGNGVEFFGNVITDNVTLGIGLASNILNCQVAGSDCPPYPDGYDPYVKNIYIHDNLFTNNGADPQGDFGLLFNVLGFGGPGNPPVPEVVWDGYLEPGTLEAGICLGTDAAAAASSLVIGDECQDIRDLDDPDKLAEYIGCANTNKETDPAYMLCEP